jgi:glycosyltransferase involved in cell wall biosynthesis
MKRTRLLVFIPSYMAERHLEWVIDRIPRDLDDEFDVEVAVFDDASADRTADVAMRAFDKADLPYGCRVLANPRNQGYGGNQKLGYQYAITAGFDVVVMVHGDGQYPPEEIREIARCALEHGAAFGSRFAMEGGALEGGMPRYKFLGNQTLTTVQNGLLGTELTEFHSGFRAYRTDVLKAIPFSLNSNDFHFDTEIFIQLIRGGFDIGEIAIPTHYGDEECRVNGIDYARNVVSQSLRSRLHDMGLFYERKYDVRGREGLYESKIDFASPAYVALQKIPPRSTVLDLGSSDGHLARALKEKGCRVIGVDLDLPEDDTAFAHFIQYNLDDGLPEIDEDIDVVVMLDVIEHLRSPEDFAEKLADFCRQHNVLRLHVSSGNVAFAAQRLMLLLGQFNYGPRGILDMTHTRLFTGRTLRRVFRQSGFAVSSIEGVPAPFPLALGDGPRARMLLRMNQLAIKFLPRVFSFQFFVDLQPPADLDHLIQQSHVHAGTTTSTTQTPLLLINSQLDEHSETADEAASKR